MKSIIPEQNQSTIFDKLIQAAMDDFIAEGEVKEICFVKSLGVRFLSLGFHIRGTLWYVTEKSKT